MTPRPASVPLVALDRTTDDLRARLAEAFERVVSSGTFVLGAELSAFEAEWAGFCGVDHAVGVASGTAALALALEALGIGPGDEVIVPAHTFVATALAVVDVGALPVVCDVESGTGLIDCRAAEAAISARTAAIIAVHLYGQACDMDTLETLATRHSLALVEDAAQAHGATFRGRRCGSLGTIACFSFYPTKNLGALGDGGAVCTSDPRLAERVRHARNFGRLIKGRHEAPARNERLDELQAALLRVKLPALEQQNARRREHATRYAASLDERIKLLEEATSSPCIYHVFPVRSDARDELAVELDRQGIRTGLHYSPALTGQPVLAGRIQVREPVPEAEAWAAEELSLPIFPELAPAERDRVIEACAAWTARTRR
jgi:dTDP-4-amino-4,6-dideoxygalactose transaminase